MAAVGTVFKTNYNNESTLFAINQTIVIAVAKVIKKNNTDCNAKRNYNLVKWICGIMPI